MTCPRKPIRGRAIFEESVQVDLLLAAVNLDHVRSLFSGLFDRAAGAVHGAGFDLDDVVVERYVSCRGAHGNHLIREVPLSRLDRFASAVEGLGSPALGPSTTRIVGIGVRVFVEHIPEQPADGP
jgi:hypothetical protein